MDEVVDKRAMRLIIQTMPRIKSLDPLSRTRHDGGKDLGIYSNMEYAESAESILKTILGRGNMAINDWIQRRTEAHSTRH